MIKRPKIIRKYYDFFNQTPPKRVNLLYGGAGSAKSYSIAQHFIRKFYEEKNKRFLVIRKTLPALRITAYKLVTDLITEYGLPKNLNKSEMLLTYGDNEMLFKGLDDPEKIKSYESNYIWVEEMTDITIDDFRQLMLRLRRKTDGVNQFFGSFNPISELHWIKRKLFKGMPNVAILHTTYKDNPFLDPEYIKEIEDLKNQDENYYRIYALGEWGMLKTIIYTNYEVIDYKDYPTYEEADEVIYGMDFGYNNPSAIIEIIIKDGVYYEKELLYETGLTNQDLIARAEKLIPDKNKEIYADSAEPDRIKEFQNAGFNIFPSDKGKGSVKDGIDFVKRQKIKITNDSPHLIKEKQSYKYKEDKDGNVLDEPVKFADHLMSAERYAIKTHANKTYPEIRFL